MFDGRGDVCFFVPSHCRILFHQQPAHRSRSSNHQAFHNVSWRTFSVRKKQGVANWFNNWSTGWRQWRLLKSLLQYIIQNMCAHSNIQGENMENSLLSSLSPVGCFTLLFLKRRQRKAPRFITCVQSYLEGEWTGIRSHSRTSFRTRIGIRRSPIFLNHDFTSFKSGISQTRDPAPNMRTHWSFPS